jgi:hypothetical protein
MKRIDAQVVRNDQENVWFFNRHCVSPPAFLWGGCASHKTLFDQ